MVTARARVVSCEYIGQKFWGKILNEFTKKQTHQCCPRGWRGVEVITGDYDFDASITRASNEAGRSALRMHLSREAYGPITSYRGYDNYTGDD